jgi:hypothetical protein
MNTIKIRVIKSDPMAGQSGVEPLIGKEFVGRRVLADYDKKPIGYEVESDDFGGKVFLRLSEVEVIP